MSRLSALSAPDAGKTGGPVRQRTVLCLAGPTGAGKTALALTLARQLGCEVINADSRQIYKDFPIITAQPSAEERSCCPHHLYGYLSTSQRSDTASWVTRACKKADEIRAAGRIPLFVGGTGFYFQTLLHGLADIPDVPEDIRTALKEELQQRGSQALHTELAKVDPAAAARLHPNDRQRILRALEVFRATGCPLSGWHKKAAATAPCRGPLLVVSTPLKDLESRLLARIYMMLDAGALAEAEKALAACPDADAPGWSGIGCREVRAFLEGRLDRQQMVELWYKNTRAYAKRQITWFRGRPETCWINPEKPDSVLETCSAYLQENPPA